MKAETKYELDQKVATHEGNGRIEMIGITDAGTRYLVLLDNAGGKTWQTEAELDKENKKQAGGPAGQQAGKVAALIALLLSLCFANNAGAQASGYETKQDISTSTNWAEVCFPAQGSVQAVLRSLEVQSDAATNAVYILGGTTPIPVQYSLNVTQLVVASNAGVITNQYGIISLPASNALFLVNILYTNQLTNIFIGGPGPVKAALNTTFLSGITNTNTLFWVCTNQSIIWPGIGRMTLDGALFSAKANAPLGVRAGSSSGPSGGASNQIRRAVLERFYPSPGLVQ